MSLATPRGKGEGVMQQTIQKVLEKNHHLAQHTLDDLSKGKAAECTQRQEILHGSPAYLATIWDSSQNMQSPLLPSQSGAGCWDPEVCPRVALPWSCTPQGSLTDPVHMAQIRSHPRRVSVQ